VDSKKKQKTKEKSQKKSKYKQNTTKEGKKKSSESPPQVATVLIARTVVESPDSGRMRVTSVCAVLISQSETV